MSKRSLSPSRLDVYHDRAFVTTVTRKQTAPEIAGKLPVRGGMIRCAVRSERGWDTFYRIGDERSDEVRAARRAQMNQPTLPERGSRGQTEGGSND